MSIITTTLSNRRNPYGEFVVKVKVDGVRRPEMDYFTDDWFDATDTEKVMVENFQRLEARRTSTLDVMA